MPAVKSLEDLKRLKEQALQKRDAKTTSGRAQVAVGMGTCGIAAGARATMKAVLDSIEADQLAGVLVTQTGCIGKCEWEPIVEVSLSGQKSVYGKVTPERVARIMREHVVGGQPIKEWEIPA